MVNLVKPKIIKVEMYTILDSPNILLPHAIIGPNGPVALTAWPGRREAISWWEKDSH